MVWKNARFQKVGYVTMGLRPIACQGCVWVSRHIKLLRNLLAFLKCAIEDVQFAFTHDVYFTPHECSSMFSSGLSGSEIWIERPIGLDWRIRYTTVL